MNIDWKALSQSKGYRSLKAAYEDDAYDAGKHPRPMRSKEVLYKRFQWVINRAKHYAVRTGRSMEQVLDEWEEKRNCWWFGYYQEINQPKLPSGKPSNVKPMKTGTHYRRHLNTGYYGSRTETFLKLQQRRREAQRDRRNALGKKPRWPMSRKNGVRLLRKYPPAQPI